MGGNILHPIYRVKNDFGGYGYLEQSLARGNPARDAVQLTTYEDTKEAGSWGGSAKCSLLHLAEASLDVGKTKRLEKMFK